MGHDTKSQKREKKRLEKKPEDRDQCRLKYFNSNCKLYPELCRSDVSIHPSYTNLKHLPYSITTRLRNQQVKKQISRQLNREVLHFAMMQMFAIDGVRIDRVFTVGMPPEALIVPDFANDKERRRINDLLRYS